MKHINKIKYIYKIIIYDGESKCFMELNSIICKSNSYKYIIELINI